MENEKFKQCFDVLNVSIDYLNMVLRLTKSGTVTRLLPSVCSPIFGVGFG